MEAKHTAGPWELRVNGMGGLDSMTCPQGEDHPVAAVTGYYSNAGQMLPNARLIAAAPELLEALARLSAQCERLRLPGQRQTDAEANALAVIQRCFRLID